MGTLANSEDPDEMWHDMAVFHQGLHNLLKRKWLTYNFNLEIITVTPSIYKMGYPKFIVSNQKEESIHA